MEWPEPEQRELWKEVHSGVDLAWAPPGTPPVVAPCRNCGSPGPKPVLLDASVVLPRQGRWRSHLLDCPECGCAFAEEALAFDYEHNAASETAVAYHVEVGAGLWPIVRAVARVEAPPGSKYLEIGCGFGFALDYATRARGWAGRGIDPSPIATAARDKLGLSIENRYFLMEEAAGTDADVIVAGEVLEHMADPLAFVRTLKAALKPGGTLVVTTPDRAALVPGKPLAAIVPILSVGAHVVLETARSLRRLLELAGFTSIDVSSESEQLTAYASTAPLRLERAMAVLRSRFRAYLDARVAATSVRDYVWWGFAARAHLEAVVDQDWDTADRVWPELVAECRRRFGFDLEDSASRPRTRGLELWELPDHVPKGLPSILYARALQRMNQHGASLTELAPVFRAAAEAAFDLNAALKTHAAEDLATLGVERSARAALAAEAADAGRGDALGLLADAVAIDPAERLGLARRSLVGLTNTGEFSRARDLLASYDVGIARLDGLPGGTAPSPAERDTLHSLAMLDLQGGDTLADAARRFAALREGLEIGGLWWSALRGECLARDQLGQAEMSTELLRDASSDGMPDDLRRRLHAHGAEASP